MSPRRFSRAAAAVAFACLVAGGCAAGNQMKAGSGEGAAAADTAAASAAGATALASMSGDELLQKRCKSCHAVPEPEGYKHEEWIKALTKMKRRIKLPAASWDSLAVLVPPEAP